MKTVTLKFTVSKETKGTFKFDEVETPGQPPILRNLYACKWWLPAGTTELEVEVRVK